MKQLIWKLILPLTIISFAIFTKWWLVFPIDAPDSMMVGFPLPYACDAWHTSMAIQIFFLELFIDIAVYFLFWIILVWAINRYLLRIKLHKLFTILLLSISGLLVVYLFFITFFFDNVFLLKRNFQIEILETGYKFIWEGNKRPENIEKYYQKK